MALVLASASPQRRTILADLGLDFTVRPSDAGELTVGEPDVVAAENARRKVLAVPARDGELVLGCDTVVAHDDTLWGKPADERDARRTLLELSGRTHEVVSAIALRRGADDIVTAVESTAVTFRPLGERLLDTYLATGEWRGRAGGYAIQGAGAVLVDRVDGCLLNVIGLPVSLLLEHAPELA